jgi:hypothetical protein
MVAVGLRVPTKQIRDFSTFNVSNVSRRSPSVKCVTAASNTCKSLEVINRHIVSVETTLSTV